MIRIDKKNAILTKEFKSFDMVTRPKYFVEYKGQKNICNQMKIFIHAAMSRKDSLDHTLILGSPGLGKTTLANIISNEMGVSIKQTSGPILEKPGDLVALLTNLEKNDVLFIDEIHRLKSSVEEFLYPAMEEFKIDILIGEGIGKRSVKINLPPFTLIGATTRDYLLTSPLRGRFGIIQRLGFYNVEDLTQIIMQSSKILNINIKKEAAEEIAKRSRGTPRITNRLLRRVRDFVEVRFDGILSKETVKYALNFLQIDSLGLDYMDHKILSTIIQKFNGGPVGLKNLSIAVNEDKNIIEEIIEPFLIQRGYIIRTPKGRLVTNLVYQHFNNYFPFIQNK